MAGRRLDSLRCMVAIEVVVVTADDWPLWRRLRRAALADAPEAFGSTLAQWSGPDDTESRWRQRLLTVPLNLVLSIDRAPVGMVSATERVSSGGLEVGLIGLWVAPAGRGHGVGDAAIDHVVSWATDRRARSVVLSVRTANPPARRLYARHGFVDAGASPDDPRERLMRRPLPGPPPVR